MRQSKFSAQEVAEMDETKQKQTRNNGFKLMSVRDLGYKKLSNGASVLWHTDNPPTDIQNGVEVTQGTIPEGTFGIRVDGQTILFDAEELQKYLRWA